MIPDKIYLYKCKKQGIRTDGICTEWSEKPVILTEENIEYIFFRKDTLLEWKKELEEHVRKCAGGIVGQYENGYWKALDDLIDKLNEI